MRRRIVVGSLLLLGGAAGCQSFGVNNGPGMTLEYGSVINGRSISVKSAILPDGTSFSHPGSVGGFGIIKWRTWGRVPTKTMAASGDYRALPEWVEFVWQEPPYPGLEPEDFPDRNAFRAAVFKLFSELPFKTQRLEIKSRIPQTVVAEVMASKKAAQPGKVSDKTLWIYIFWTPDGIKMRWAMKDQKAGVGAFGPVVKEGGDDLDQYSL